MLLKTAPRTEFKLQITMHCGGTLAEKSLGGSETAAACVALELAKQGHAVTVFTSITTSSQCGGVRYIPMGTMTDQCPMGEDFHSYSLATPVDVMIIQRHPLAFRFPWASKINLWWLHDLATPDLKDTVTAMMFNITGILAVSEWHREQIIDTWELNPLIVTAIQNGVNGDLYHPDYSHKILCPSGDLKMIYSSRPERGLENLVGDDGIMERLLTKHPDAHLYVCNYDNVTPRMEGYYRYLNDRCEELSNVTVLGNLTKTKLAQAQIECDLCVYPTAFEETSCITAMECMSALLPFLSSDTGALKETCKDSGAVLIPLLPNDEHYRGMEIRIKGKIDIDAFTDKIATWALDTNLADKQLAASSKFPWVVAASLLLNHISLLFKISSDSSPAIALDMLRKSDIYALRGFIGDASDTSGRIIESIKQEVKECYSFMDGGYTKHYADYYDYELKRGVNYGEEILDGSPRFEFVADLISSLPDQSTVLDYGCAHGHYTINLALRFPKIQFIGVDITPSNVEKARRWSAAKSVPNVEFRAGEIVSGKLNFKQDASLAAVIAAEVLEHLESPANVADALSNYLSDDGIMIITTPYGSWEAQGYEEHWPWRAHVHHLDRSDLHALYSHHKNFSITTVPAGQDVAGEPLGSYVTIYGKETEPSGEVDYARKFAVVSPRQTVSLCMIVKDEAKDIVRCLDSAKNAVDEIIVGLDETTTDDTGRLIREFCAKARIPCEIYLTKSPMEVGFDAARNVNIDKAEGDWILWLDADEILQGGSNLAKYLRRNQFAGYAIAQHHFSMQPLGVLKTDYPVRIFRNFENIQFFGVVHEHPEKKLNEGVGHAINLPDVQIGHYGYTDEAVRRARFDRNLELMLRDREKHPERELGKFLWMRDLAQMCGYDLERNGGRITDEIVARAVRGVELFRDLLKPSTIRMAVDGLEFYSKLSQILGGGFDFKAEIESHWVEGHFNDTKHLSDLINLLINDRMKKHGRSKQIR